MRFSTEEKLLLSAFLPTTASRARLAALAPAVADWNALVARAETLLLTPLLRAHLAQTSCLDTLPEPARQQLDQGHQVWAARELNYVAAARRLLAALTQAGIPAMPLKGAALILLNVYPQVGLRPALDLDVLVAPANLARAEEIAETCGYSVMPGRTAARPQQRLANELNHAAPRRGTSGLILELHTRAFHIVQQSRDVGWQEFATEAKFQDGWWQPALADTALHLLHHTMVDWQSSKAILRTLADLHFIFAKEENARAQLANRALHFGLAGTFTAAENALHHLSNDSLPGLETAYAQDGALRLLLETALLTDARALADAARLFEYFDFTRQPFERLRALASLLFTNRAHLQQLYGNDANLAQRYARRPFDLLRKFNWASVQPKILKRVWQLRQLANRIPANSTRA